MQIHVARAGKELGVFSQEEVRSRIASGEFLTTDHGWAAGQGDWKLLSAFPDLIPPPKPSPLPPPPEPVRELPPRPEPVGNFRRPKKKPSGEPSELGLAPATTPPASAKVEPAPVVAEKTVVTPEPVKVPMPVEAPQQPTPIVARTPVAEATQAKPAEPEPAPKPKTIYFEPEKPVESVLPEATPRVEVQPEPVREPEIKPEPELETEPETPQPIARRQDLEPDSENVIRVTLESKPRHTEPEPAEELEPAAPRQTYQPTVPTEAVASMVLGLLSISFLPILAALPAVSLGHIAKRRIESSHGMLRGAGMALTGLVTGYIGSAVALVALLWAVAQAFIGFVDTRAAQETSITHGRQIAVACRMYAVEHDGKFPESLEKLVPKYLPDSQAFSCPFSDPSEVIGYHYYGGTDSEVQGKVLLISKGRTTRKRHVIVYADATTALLKVPSAASQEAAP